MKLEFLYKHRIKPCIEKELVKAINQHTLNDIWDYVLVIHGSFSLPQSQNLSDNPAKPKDIFLQWPFITVSLSHSLIWMVSLMNLLFHHANPWECDATPHVVELLCLGLFRLFNLSYLASSASQPTFLARGPRDCTSATVPLVPVCAKNGDILAPFALLWKQSQGRPCVFMGIGILWVFLHPGKLCNKSVFLEVNVSHRLFFPAVSTHWDQTELSQLMPK